MRRLAPLSWHRDDPQRREDHRPKRRQAPAGKIATGVGTGLGTWCRGWSSYARHSGPSNRQEDRRWFGSLRRHLRSAVAGCLEWRGLCRAPTGPSRSGSGLGSPANRWRVYLKLSAHTPRVQTIQVAIRGAVTELAAAGADAQAARRRMPRQFRARERGHLFQLRDPDFNGLRRHLPGTSGGTQSVQL